MYQHAAREVGDPHGLAMALLAIEFRAKIDAARRQGGRDVALRLNALYQERQAAEAALRQAVKSRRRLRTANRWSRPKVAAAGLRRHLTGSNISFMLQQMMLL